jgi:uncharacterized protein involved in exopolysaccharide biosynthesis
MSVDTMQRLDDEVVDLRYVLARLIAFWRWIAVSALVFMLGAAAVAFLMRPVYRASTVMIASDVGNEGMGGAISSALGSIGGLASLAGLGLGGNAARAEEALAVLKSRQFTEAFIRERNLMPVLFPDDWDVQAKRWRGSEDDWPTYGKAYKKFDERIRTVEQDKKTGLITLHVDWRDRAQAAQWANELVERLNLEMRSRAIAKSSAAVGYLEKELESTIVVATREAINRLIEAQVKERMLANVTQEYSFRVVDKAMAPDKDDPLRPQKVLLLAGGLFAGLCVGFAAVLMFAPAGAPRRDGA